MTLTWLEKDIPLADLNEYAHNPRTITKKAFDRLVQSIKQDGYHARIVIDTDNCIIAGHSRKKALLANGWKPTDCIKVLYPNRQLTEAEFKRVNIRDNLEFGDFDSDILANHFDLDFLKDIGMDIKFDMPISISEEEDALLSLDTAKLPISKEGDIWILGNHRLMCGDSSKLEHINKLLGNISIDMVFTDPPYNCASNTKMIAAGSNNKAAGILKNADWDKNFNIELFLQNLLNVIGENITVYICTSHHLAGIIWAWMNTWATHHSYCVWAKPNPMPSLMKRHWTFNTELICHATKGKYTFNFPNAGHALSTWSFNKLSHNELHPTQKPLDIPLHAILHSSDKGHYILDAFGGSGTTLIACEKSGRNCLMMELSPHYCDMIISRWEKHTGKTAIKEAA